MSVCCLQIHFLWEKDALPCRRLGWGEGPKQQQWMLDPATGVPKEVTMAN